ncbi:hypothetical protein OU426_01605 [Frigidibacter sp. RF13]|uniref:hypothetical protein n=1 Tax=Frigidibacter sp. RF13 TaxID=2997340 RepID=UPI00226D9878|nr:hypothetical protein [Frigidibacter sp. RF13]MCY1125536.1 hypothetical protein [Frigidibacter sp. RF13]
MRWLFIGLGLFGLIFVAAMIFAPNGRSWKTGEDAPPPPGWAKALGGVATAFAPHLDSFADGSTSVSLAKGETAQRALARDPKRDNRLLTLVLVQGGPVRVSYRCAPAPKSDCKARTEVLCLGAPLHGDCSEQEKPSGRGSFSVRLGGGSLSVENDGNGPAQITIDD